LVVQATLRSLLSSVPTSSTATINSIILSDHITNRIGAQPCTTIFTLRQQRLAAIPESEAKIRV
jgi:hypothetical protein